MKANFAWLLSFMVMAALAAAQKPAPPLSKAEVGSRMWTAYRPPDLPVPMPHYTSECSLLDHP